MTPDYDKIERAFSVGDRVANVTASDELKQRLMRIPTSVKEGYNKIPMKFVWAAAASIALLIALNVLSARNYSKESASSQSTSSYFNHLKTL